MDERIMKIDCLPQGENGKYLLTFNSLFIPLDGNENPRFVFNYVDNKFMALVNHRSSDKFYEFQIDEQKGTLQSREMFCFSCLGDGSSYGFVSY
jgi:hypothetical protein